MGVHEARENRLREVLARLDRIATISRGHRAGLHLDDPKLFEQYLAVLDAFQVEPVMPGERHSIDGAAIASAPQALRR